MSLIELPYDKILQWVIARGKTPEDCNKRLIALEELCKEFFSKYTDLPEDVRELQKHVQDNNTEWYEVIADITKRLKETGQGNKKNFFGNFTYEPLYDADRILNSFQKNNLHIASFFQLLQKQMNYNIPSIKKSIERSNKELSDLNSRRAESIRKMNATTTELNNRLKNYGMEIKDYPFKEEFGFHFKLKLIQEIATKNADVTIDNYRHTLKILRLIDSEVIPTFNAFVKYQRMDPLYNDNESMSHIKHAAQHGLDETTSLSQEAEDNVETGNEEDKDDIAITVLDVDEKVPITEDKRRIIFSSNLGNPNFRQRLLGDILELRAFLTIRMDELQNKSGTANYIFSQTGDRIDENIMKPVSQYENYLEAMNEVIDKLSGTETMKALSILKNKSDLEKAANREVVMWNRCCKEVTEQAQLEQRIEAAKETLLKLTSDLEVARKAVKDTKAKLESSVTEVMGSTVKLFGEIDNI